MQITPKSLPEDTATAHSTRRPWPDMGSQCPLAARKNVGIFNSTTSNSTFQNEFQNVILLVSCNFAYYDMLQNWEYMAKQLGLQWAVLALDEKLYEELGEERAISPEHDFSVSGAQLFRQGQFNKLSCNKMRMVMKVAQYCDVDVVFSDVDNVFYHNPFEHDLGRLIISQRYEYIYQTNGLGADQPLKDDCLNGMHDKAEGNTGFYYVSGKSQTMQSIVNSTLEVCAEPGNGLDDQTIFWETFRTEEDNRIAQNNSMHYCDGPEYLDPTRNVGQYSDGTTFSYCCLDPYYYPVGRPFPPHNKDPTTFHANFVYGHDGKIDKLIKSRSDGYGWNTTRIEFGNE
jgi:Nucleotide-diphospho-sugar transferase